MVFAEIDLARTPVASGQALYLLLQANISLAETGVSLLMDAGDGAGWRSSSQSDSAVGWGAHSYQLTMNVTGTAKFGMQVGTSAFVCTTRTLVHKISLSEFFTCSRMAVSFAMRAIVLVVLTLPMCD